MDKSELLNFIPLIASLLFLACVFILFYRHKDSGVVADRYKEQFDSFLKKTEELTLRLNMLEGMVIACKDNEALSFYEKCLLKFERLLTAFQELKLHPNNFRLLKAGFNLLKKTEVQVIKIEDFLDIKFKKTIKKKPLLPQEKKTPIGCYFCSKPFFQTNFTKVKVKIDNEIKKVYSCEECAQKLKTQGTVKILYFTKGSKTYHWSQVADYNPIRDFNNLSSISDSVKKDAKLRLVYSRPKQPLDDFIKKDKGKDKK